MDQLNLCLWPPQASQGAGKFSGEVELFYLEIVRQPLKTKALVLAEGLHSQSQWGRRAEDPFRGLRAGPVRYSPLSLSPSGDPDCLRGAHRITPKTPRTLPNTAKVRLKTKKPRWEFLERSIKLPQRERCGLRFRLTGNEREWAGRDGPRRAAFRVDECRSR